MANKHKDLPSGSQAWAGDVDALMEEVKQLKEVVKRLSQNASLDFSNPRRGINTGDIPSVQSPVGQKLSSLADVQTYNVADKQVLSWSGKDQRWLPVTLPESSGGGFFPIPMAYDQSGIVGFGDIDSTAPIWTGTAYEDKPIYAYVGTSTNGGAEMWGRKSVYLGAGDWSDYPNTGYTYFEQQSYNGDAYTAIETVSYTGSGARLVVNGNAVFLQYAPFYFEKFTTADRPAMVEGDDEGAGIWDWDLKIPIWWNGTTWINAVGTAV